MKKEPQELKNKCARHSAEMCGRDGDIVQQAEITALICKLRLTEAPAALGVVELLASDINSCSCAQTNMPGVKLSSLPVLLAEGLPRAIIQSMCYVMDIMLLFFYTSFS